MSGGRLPDFIVLGAPKAATTTLHYQLERQPGIFMTREKEPAFFSDDANWERGIEWYQSLFAPASHGDLCGEASPQYTVRTENPNSAERMHRVLSDDARLIYVMRHPIERLVSAYHFRWTNGWLSEPISDAIRLHPILVESSRYDWQLEPYLERFKPEQISPVFFERLVGSPDAEFARVCQFLGYQGTPEWEHDLVANISSERLKRSRLVDLVSRSPGVLKVARVLLPSPLRRRIRGHWQVKERPSTPSAEDLAYLESEFDPGLARLGDLLGLELTCANFSDVAKATPAEWSVNRTPA